MKIAQHPAPTNTNSTAPKDNSASPLTENSNAPITSPQRQAEKRPKYHHGDLKPALLKAAEELLIDKGSHGLTMRDLSRRIGVSRTAAYHHFKDRADLLAALASQGLDELIGQASAVMENQRLSPQEKFRSLMLTYVNYATQHPQKYDLMVGNRLWMEHSVPALQEQARHAFRTYVGWITELSREKVIPTDNPLRTAQLTWSTLHGLCKLVTDGIFARRKDMDEIVQYGVDLFTKQSHLL